MAFGRIIAPDYRAALRQIAAVLGTVYEPGTVERGLFDMMATEPSTHGGLDVTHPAVPRAGSPLIDWRIVSTTSAGSLSFGM